jgi:hypothetical protein
LLEDGLAKLQAAFVALGDSVTVGRTRAPITVLGDPPWQPEYFDDVLDLPLQQQRLYDIRKQRDVKRLHEHLDWLEPQLQALAVPAGVTVGEWDWPALLEHEASVQEAAASGTPMVSVATEEVAANHSARMPHEWHHRIHGLTYEQTFEVCAELYRRKHAGETWSQLAASYVVAESTLRDRYDWYVETTGAPT